ncbi:hypothetical protein ACIF8W_17380 [Streptomyces sp. NPDC085639]|uniref:hypothetical protein n=1 Tax=Streptomyces sp. NPDC085639 TaxID=3365734 RepID=UPI0037D203FC
MLAYAADGQWHGRLPTALDALARHGHPTPAVREALTALVTADRRLPEYGDYRAFHQDEGIRARIDRLLATTRTI